MTYIKIYTNLTIGVVSFPPGSDIPKSIEILKTNNGNILDIIYYSPSLPDEILYPMACWLWDTNLEEITINTELIPINWAGIYAGLSATLALTKDKAELYFLAMKDAALSADIDYFAASYEKALSKLTTEEETTLNAMLESNFYDIEYEPPF